MINIVTVALLQLDSWGFRGPVQRPIRAGL